MSTDEINQTNRSHEPMETARGLENDPGAETAREARRLWEVTVASLTAAARLDWPDGTPLDLPQFVANALAAAAGNLNGIERVTQGVAGSWEEHHVRALVEGVLGTDPAQVYRLRTDPVRVPLNVAQLVEDTYEQANRAGRVPQIEPWEIAREALPDPWTADHEATPEERATTTAAEDALTAAYQHAYDDYARRFTAAVHDAARALMPEHVVVEVVVETDPTGPLSGPDYIDNPSSEWGEDGPDPLPWRLWSAAREATGLPALDTAETTEPVTGTTGE